MRHAGCLFVAFVLVGVTAAPASADGAFGLGPRFSFVRGSAGAESSTRYSGGLLRLRTSPRVALELALDYRSVLNDSLRQRIKDYPIQGSLLLYVTRAPFAPYLVGGFGWYTLRIEQLDGTGAPVGPVERTRKTGYHAGLGADLRVSRHAALHADYRYTFIHFGDQAEATEPGVLPIPGTGSIQQRLKLSHQGSMWTTGLTVYF
jgi:opacity protein-like surface antigen